MCGQANEPTTGRTSTKISLLLLLLTPWSRVLLEKLTSFQLVNKFPASYGTRKFITAVIIIIIIIIIIISFTNRKGCAFWNRRLL
jgi:hypothetical protein